MASSRSRIPTPLATIIVLTLVGGLCWWGAQSAAGFIEKRSREDAEIALSSSGYDWVAVETNGLQVRLTGTAPTEVDRFRAMSQVAGVVDSSRIVDDMTVAATEALTPPAFKIELLRNDDGISLIGLVPASTERADLIRRLKIETAAPKVTDLLETADYPAPEGWDEAVDFGLAAAQLVGRAKISIEAAAVQIAAITDSRAEKGRVETELKRSRPAEITLTTEISAPRPVIAPFTLRFVIDDSGPHFDACAADSETARDRIIDAAVAAGAKGKPGCTLGLGSPSASWADAAVPAIQALAALGAGSVTISDADIALIAPPGVPRDKFDAEIGKLEAALPRVFTLQARLEQQKETDDGPEEFRASMSDTRAVDLQGRITDQRMREAVGSFARARFASVEDNLRSDADLPGGWTVRVIAALEAMDALHEGSVEVTPDMIRLTGTSGEPTATDLASATLSHRLGAGAKYQLSIRYDRRLDPALALPDGEECVGRLNNIMSESEIGFEPSKSTIAGDPGPTLQQIGAVMALCNEYRIEAGGHTDSQGSEGFNADLSRARAQALVAAIGEAGIDTSNMTARGYGESRPIAPNDTEEGREANRRIEFQLLSPHPVRSAPLPEPVTVSGVTAEEAPATTTDEPKGEMQGPPMPNTTTGDAMVPATFGASEEFETLDEREEKLRLPVQTPDENTPRPSPRPDSVVDAAGDGASDSADAGTPDEDAAGQSDETAE